MGPSARLSLGGRFGVRRVGDGPVYLGPAHYRCFTGSATAVATPGGRVRFANHRTPLAVGKDRRFASHFAGGIGPGPDGGVFSRSGALLPRLGGRVDGVWLAGPAP